MALSSEYLTLINCTRVLELALKDKRDIVHFLECKNFISREIHDDVLNPKSTLTSVERVGRLVEKIKDKVQLDSKNYYVFMNELRSNLRIYGEIIEIMDSEFNKHTTQTSGEEGTLPWATAPLSWKEDELLEEDHLVSSTPSLSISALTCLRLTDKGGQARILRICDKISPRWEEAGDLLGLTADRLKGIHMQRLGDVSMCCRDVLVDWLHENQGGYPATWVGVVQLLEDMKLSAAALQLKNALL